MSHNLLHSDSQEDAKPKPRYKWPWLVLAAFVLAVVLAIVWMSKEIERIRRIRDANSPNTPVGR